LLYIILCLGAYFGEEETEEDQGLLEVSVIAEQYSMFGLDQAIC